MTVLFVTDLHHGYSAIGDAAWAAVWRDLAAREPVDHILVGGDVGSHLPSLVVAGLAQLRQFFPSAGLHWLQGNHDWWGPLAAPEETLTWIRRQAAGWGAHYLQDGPLILPEAGLAVAGFSGWYEAWPLTNDPERIQNFGKAQIWLQAHAAVGHSQALAVCRQQAAHGLSTILLTHFPFFAAAPDWKGGAAYFGGARAWEADLSGVDLVVYGHTHRRYSGVTAAGVTYLNAGADYEQPAYWLWRDGQWSHGP